MQVTQLIRLSGLAALAAGILRISSAFIPAASAGNQDWIELVYLLTDLNILFSLVGIYSHLADKVGIWGLAGFIVSLSSTGLIIGPDGVLAGIALYPVGAGGLAVGLVLLGIGVLLAPTLRHTNWRWLAILWLLLPIVGFSGYFIPDLAVLFMVSGVLFGLSFVGAGFELVRRTAVDRASSPQLEPTQIYN